MAKIVLVEMLKKARDAYKRAGNGGVLKLSEDAGLKRTAVRDAIRTGNPTIRTLVPLAEYLNVSLSQLVFGTENQAIEIPVVGIVSAGDGWENPDNAEHDPIEFRLDGQGLIAIEIRGESMYPAYRSGDFLVCVKHSGRNLDNLIGLDCAVQTSDGSGYVKKLLRGTKKNRYNLKSYNLAYEDIVDAEVVWAAPVQWIKRSGR